MVTARQFSELRGVPYTTVIFWLKKELLKGAEKQEIPFGRQGFIWRVPDDALLPELTPGPVPKATKKAEPKAKPVKKAVKKKKES